MYRKSAADVTTVVFVHSSSPEVKVFKFMPYSYHVDVCLTLLVVYTMISCMWAIGKLKPCDIM